MLRGLGCDWKPLTVLRGTTKRPGNSVVLLLAGLLAAAPALADDAERAGTALAEAVHGRPIGDDAVTRGTMTLIERGREPRVRETFQYRLEAADGGRQTLIRFTSPADIADTGLLIHDHADGATDQWLYLPAMDRVRRIAADRRGGRFVGSDLFFEDLEDRAPERDRHRLLSEETWDGAALQVLESVPVAGDGSVYSRRVSWIDPETLIPLRIDFYRGGDEPMKRLEVTRVARIDGYWTEMETTVTDLESGHRTVLVVDEVVYDQGLPGTLFTSRALADTRVERRYRP